MNRRTLLAGTASLAAGGVAWATVGWSVAPARAQVSAGGFDIADASYAATGGDIYSPHLSAELAYEYEGADDAAAVLVAILVDGSLLASEVVEGVAAPADSGRETLAAPLVQARTIDESMWTAPDGGEVSHTLTVEGRLEVRDSGGATLAKDSLATDVTVTVSDAGPAMTATLSGTGDVSFVPVEGGTPTDDG